MIERLTYLCGIAVAVISWAIGQLVSDLTSVPVVYTSTSTSSGNSTSDTRFEVRNLSRSKRIMALGINVLAPPDCITSIKPDGTEWTLESAVDGSLVPVKSLMPGSVQFVSVTHPSKCQVHFGIGFGEPAAVRTITGGVESFLLLHWLVIIVVLVLGGALVFGVTLWKAYQLSKPAPPVQQAAPVLQPAAPVP